MSSAASNLVNKVWNYYEDLIKRDKANLDIFWLRDDSLGDSSDLPDPAILAAEIVEDLQAALDQFAQIAADLGATESEAERN
jgi:type I restriction enzyme M protein